MGVFARQHALYVADDCDHTVYAVNLGTVAITPV